MSHRAFRTAIRRAVPPLLLAWAAGLPAPAASGEERTVVATRESKKEILLLLEDEVVMLVKWPLAVHVFDTAGLSGCSLSYSTDIIDIQQLKVEDDGGSPAIRCGKTRAPSRRAAELTVALGEVGSGRREWSVITEGERMALRLRAPDEPAWTVTFPHP